MQERTIDMRPIPGYPGYLATEFGEIISTRSIPFRILATRIHKGYLHVNIKTGSGRHTQKKEPVHKLVLLAFHGPKPNGMECRHLNGNATDNHHLNLKWGTPTENMQDQMRHGTAVCLRHGEEHVRSKLKESDVLEIARLVEQGHKQSDIAKRFGIHQTHVRDIKFKRTWQHLWTDPQGHENPSHL